MRLVRDVAETFERSAVDDAHTPALCSSSVLASQFGLLTCFSLSDASFLRTLIDNKLHGTRTVPGSRAGTRPPSPVAGGSGAAGPHGHGMEAFLKSRANSVGPLEGVLGGEAGTEAGEHAFDSMAMDSMLANGGFWDNVSWCRATVLAMHSSELTLLTYRCSCLASEDLSRRSAVEREPCLATSPIPGPSLHYTRGQDPPPPSPMLSLRSTLLFRRQLRGGRVTRARSYTTSLL